MEFLGSDPPCGLHAAYSRMSLAERLPVLLSLKDRATSRQKLFGYGTSLRDLTQPAAALASPKNCAGNMLRSLLSRAQRRSFGSDTPYGLHAA